MWLKKKRKKQRLVRGRERGARLLEDVIQCCDGKSNPIKFFSADQIIKATNNFSKSNLISELKHPAYRWYSGNIDNRPMIFLPVYARRDYCRNIAISSMVSGHKNFMKLLGCCLELEKPVIVYNFINASRLDLKKVVSWKKRIKIAEDIATVLAYLHTAFPRPFVHRAMRPGSILLDEDGVVRLSDFSYCISIPQGETFVKVDRIAGAFDFVDARYFDGTVSEKTDVFAIGILMLKLLIGEEIFHAKTRIEDDDSDGDGNDNLSDGYETSDYFTTIQRWLIKYKEELRMDEIADPEMLEKMDQVGDEELCQMKAFLMLSMRCIGRTNREIPNMVEVAKELKNIQRSSFPSSASDESEIIIVYPQYISSPSSPSSFASFSSFSSYDFPR